MQVTNSDYYNLEQENKKLIQMGLNLESKYNRLVKKIEELIRIDFCESLDSEYQNNSHTRQKLQKLLKEIHNE